MAYYEDLCRVSGAEVGPDLSTIGAELSRKEILRAIVEPGARIAPGYGTVSLTLDGGEVVRGALLEESASSVVVSYDGQQREIPKEDISEYDYGASSMPAMGGVLTRSEIRDVVEYLSSLDGS